MLRVSRGARLSRPYALPYLTDHPRHRRGAVARAFAGYVASSLSSAAMSLNDEERKILEAMERATSVVPWASSPAIAFSLGDRPKLSESNRALAG
jgi:alpha-D-ribose 1-methylphosphonate 5-triphosphate diphosphatase PhnM